MENIKMNNKLINETNMDSYIFLEYIRSFGFDENNYSNILELFQSVDGSISQFIKTNNQYLLSTNVRYKDIDKSTVDGTYGYLGKDKIIVPSTTLCDRYIVNPVGYLGRKETYNRPNVNNFDVIIANEPSINNYPYHSNIAGYDIDKYIGFCIDKDCDNLTEKLLVYKKLLNKLNSKDENYIMECDSLSEMNKQLCLIRKK